MTGRCYKPNAVYRSFLGPNTLPDLFILLIPLPTIWRLEATRWKKVGISILFMMGSLGFAVSIVKWVVYFEHDASHIIPGMSTFTQLSRNPLTGKALTWSGWYSCHQSTCDVDPDRASSILHCGMLACLASPIQICRASIMGDVVARRILRKHASKRQTKRLQLWSKSRTTVGQHRRRVKASQQRLVHHKDKQITTRWLWRTPGLRNGGRESCKRTWR